MNDTLSVKGLLLSQVLAAQLDASARSFPRVAGSGKEYIRRSTHIHSLSPTDLIIQHVPRTAKNTVQRTRCAIQQTLTRFDAQSNPIKSDVFSVAITSTIPSGVSLAEFLEAYRLLLGFSTESSSANMTALFNGEF